MVDLINRVSSNDGSDAYSKQRRQSVADLKEEVDLAEDEVEGEGDARDIKTKQVNFKPAVKISPRALAYSRRHSVANTFFGMTACGLCNSGQRIMKSFKARLSICRGHLRRHWDQSSIRIFIDI